MAAAGWAVAAPGLQVADPVVDVELAAAGFGRGDHVADRVHGVGRFGAQGVAVQLGAGGQSGTGPGGEGRGADPGHPVRRVVLVAAADGPLLRGRVQVNPAAPFVRHRDVQQVGPGVGVG